MNSSTPTSPYRNIVKLFLLLLLLSSCAEVKPWQRAWLNDPAMQPDKSARAFDDYAHTIREGALMPGGDKSSGGCGCN